MELIVKFNSVANGRGAIPLAFRKSSQLRSQGVVLAGDIGGTKVNLALFEIRDGELKQLKEANFRTKEYNSFQEIYHAFYTPEFPVIDAICLGAAGPVTGGRVLGTNFSWIIDENQIKQELGVGSVSVINDLEANAFGLAALRAKDFLELKPGKNEPGNSAIISPGTGLGEAGLYWDGSHYHPFATEGGHCDFSARNELDIRLWRFLHQRFGHVSWERILSGPGIYNVYEFLVQDRKITEPKWFKEKVAREDPAAVISTCAAEGSYPVCRDTIDFFIANLAIEATQLALKFKATGGVFIGGGIIPKIIRNFDRDIFNDKFLQSDKMKDLLEMIPVKVILNEKTSLYGAAFCAAVKRE